MSPRRTAVAAPAQEPDLDAILEAVAQLPLSDLARLNAQLEELLLSRRLKLQRSGKKRS